jgi:hypothetical protein
MSKTKLVACLSLLSALVSVSFEAMANKATYTPSIINNGAALMVYSDGFGSSTSDQSEVKNLIAYLSQPKFSHANIIYLDGFNVSGGQPSTIPLLTQYPNYTYAVDQLHAIGKTVILASAIGGEDVDLEFGDASIITDLENIVRDIHADGLAFDDEISSDKQTYFSENQAGLLTLANAEVSANKYFGIITNLGGNQEGAIARLFDWVNCKANPSATDYCFESIMRYDSGDNTSLGTEISYIANVNKVNFYKPQGTINQQRIIRFMFPVTYSADTYPTVDSSGASTFDPNYSYQSFICDMAQIANYWTLGSFSTTQFDNDCPSGATYHITVPLDINSGGQLFSATDNLVFGGVDFYRIVNKDYATQHFEPRTRAMLDTDHYLCDPSQPADGPYACSANYRNTNLRKWVPNLDSAAPLLLPMYDLSVTPHFVSDTEETFVIDNGIPNDACTLTLSGASTSSFSLDTNGNATVPVTVAAPTRNPQGETDVYDLVCQASGAITDQTTTRYGDQLELCFTPSSGAVVCLDSLFGEKASTTPITSPQLSGGSYTISFMPTTLNNTEECDQTTHYCDATLTPYTLPANNLSINGNANLSLGFYRNTTQR